VKSRRRGIENSLGNPALQPLPGLFITNISACCLKAAIMYQSFCAGQQLLRRWFLHLLSGLRRRGALMFSNPAASPSPALPDKCKIAKY